LDEEGSTSTEHPGPQEENDAKVMKDTSIQTEEREEGGEGEKEPRPSNEKGTKRSDSNPDGPPRPLPETDTMVEDALETNSKQVGD
jgi:hypothetical protein